MVLLKHSVTKIFSSCGHRFYSRVIKRSKRLFILTLAALVLMHLLLQYQPFVDIRERAKQRIINLTPMLDDPENFKKTYGEQVLFLVDTTGGGKLETRFTCCLESIVTMNPETSVLLVLSNQTTEFPLKDNIALEELMLQTTNLYIATVDVVALANGTVLDRFISSPELRSSPTLPAHMSDFMRMLLLWKLGGAYADLDTLVIKNLSPILRKKNFLTADDVDNVNNAFLGFERHSPFLLRIMETARRRYVNTYYPTVVYSLNEAFTETFNMSVKDGIKRHQIHDLVYVFGFEIMSSMKWFESDKLFDSQNVGFYESVKNESYGYHLSNFRTKTNKLETNSTAPFAVGAREFCSMTLAFSDGFI